VTDRDTFTCVRGNPSGYGYVGHWCGPFALRHASDFPAALAHAETELAGGQRDLMLMLPLANRVAVDYALQRGFRMETDFVMLFLTDGLAPHLDRYLFTMPGFFI
jgi:hypothetical protein